MLRAADPDQPNDLFWNTPDQLADKARSGQGRYRKVLAEVTQEVARGARGGRAKAWRQGELDQGQNRAQPP
eukprot:15442-Alexandrium_andersonii.AAC.1